MPGVTVEVGVRPKNQVTIPEPALRWLDAQVGDRLVLEGDPDEPGSLRVRVVRRSYAGALRGIYGTPEEAAAYLRGERDCWDE